MNIYQTHGGKNKRISQAFAKGTGFPIVPPAPLLPGDVFMYGALRGLLPTLHQAWAENRTWYYCDNGYFQRSKNRQHKVDGYFRITKNALQHDGTGSFSSCRWGMLKWTIKPWRKDGSHILVCPPGELYGEIWGIDVVKWKQETLETLSRVTDRPIHVRERAVRSDLSKPFLGALAGAWALVTDTSNAAVEAVVEGVPVFCTAKCAAFRMGLPDVSRIEDPIMPDDREQWAWNLGANQWNIEEMADGTCWRELNEHGGLRCAEPSEESPQFI